MPSLEKSLGIGALHFGHFLSVEESRAIVEWAVNNGISYIDTSPIYGNGQSEDFVGYAIKGFRDRVTISTKFGLQTVKDANGRFGVVEEKQTKKNILQSVERSLERLKVDCIDNYVLHTYDSTTPLDEVLETLECISIDGKIASIGCSNFNPNQLSELILKSRNYPRLKLKNAQCHYNILERKAEKEFVPLVNEKKLSLVINRALGRGVLTGKYKTSEPLPENSRALSSDRIKNLLCPELLALTDELEAYAFTQDITLGQMSLLWLLQRIKIGVILIGVRNIVQLTENAGVLRKMLDSQQIMSIENIISQHKIGGLIYDSPPTFFEK
jgi:1-deoxyxylulose-5-phosphate synthase